MLSVLLSRCFTSLGRTTLACFTMLHLIASRATIIMGRGDSAEPAHIHSQSWRYHSSLSNGQSSPRLM
uniref:Putative secreted protein n=1 Tax=Anopheles darlingi TaxID=43151 RepID=A0A2M4DND3_ANODA